MSVAPLRPVTGPLTRAQHRRCVAVLVELQVLADQLVNQQVFPGQRRSRLRLVVQGVEHLGPDPSLQLGQGSPGLQRLFEGYRAAKTERPSVMVPDRSGSDGGYVL